MHKSSNVGVSSNWFGSIFKKFSQFLQSVLLFLTLQRFCFQTCGRVGRETDNRNHTPVFEEWFVANLNLY